ncbi:MAG: hypothetical protein DAHOPDDO_00794 [Ignavibacteriaceae bacterium]|nr:hypothetical protein [Ignavibacteriaceae bacterium]
MNVDEFKLKLIYNDFYNQNEFFIREEFLIPLFKLAGYSPFGSTKLFRDIKLSKSPILLNQNRRDHVYPDFVLSENEIPLWIIDAKSSKVKVNSPSNINQIYTYSEKLFCPNVILSNAIETYVYKVIDGSISEIAYFHLSDLENNKLKELLNLINSSETIRRVLSFSRVIQLYQTDNYVDRALLMKVLNSYSYNEIHSFFDQNNIDSIFKADFRTKALPAILIVPYSKKNVTSFKQIIKYSLDDSNPIVRENLWTCLISKKKSIPERNLPSEIFSISFSSFFEEFLFISFLATYKIGKNYLVSYNSSTQFFKDYINFLKKFNPVSFPPALLLKKPYNMKYKDYDSHLTYLPKLLIELLNCMATDPETIKVISICLFYCRNYNKSVFRNLLNKSNRVEKGILIYFSNLYPPTDFEHKLNGIFNIV